MIGLIFLALFLFAMGKSMSWEKQERWKQATAYKPENVHGHMHFATDEDIERGGLF